MPKTICPLKIRAAFAIRPYNPQEIDTVALCQIPNSPSRALV